MDDFEKNNYSMTSEEDKINKIRVMIDEIDLKILSLIESRASEGC